MFAWGVMLKKQLKKMLIPVKAMLGIVLIRTAWYIGRLGGK